MKPPWNHMAHDFGHLMREPDAFDFRESIFL